MLRMELLRLLGDRLYTECLVSDRSMATSVARVEEEGDRCMIGITALHVYTYIFVCVFGSLSLFHFHLSLHCSGTAAWSTLCDRPGLLDDIHIYFYSPFQGENIISVDPRMNE